MVGKGQGAVDGGGGQGAAGTLHSMGARHESRHCAGTVGSGSRGRRLGRTQEGERWLQALCGGEGTWPREPDTLQLGAGGTIPASACCLSAGSADSGPSAAFMV